MPTQTFNRLDPKKRHRFVQEACKEFALNTYQGGSITNLVKTLGIAKGSVYQYFEDKDELYRYLLEEVMQQLNELLNKTCQYEQEEFYAWYNKLLIVQLRYFLSFPPHAVLIRHSLNGILSIDRSVRKEIIASLESRIKTALPHHLANNEVALHQLVHAPIQLFNLLTSDLNLAKIISSGNPIYLSSDELMSACADWVKQVKTGC